MIQSSRRGFLRSMTVASGLTAIARAKELSSIGVQLYTVRGILPKDPLKVLKEIEAIGYREVEAIYSSLDQIWPALKQTGLSAVSVHLDSGMVTKGDTEALKRTLDDSKQRGFEYAVFPYLPPPERGGADVFKRLAAKLNSAGRQARDAGLQLCYHNHAFEFQPMESTTPLAILMDQTDPKLLALEMDVFWVSVAGHDPVEMLSRYSGRVALVHLKDKAKDLPTQFNEKVPPAAFKEVGSGVVDFPAVLRAAARAGAKHYFVEQDATPGDPIDSLRQSYAYLHNLRF